MGYPFDPSNTDSFRFPLDMDIAKPLNYSGTELNFWNEKKLNVMEDNVINRLVPRLRKIGIDVELIGNYPWIYLRKVNGNTIKERFEGNHGFTIAFLPLKDDKMELTNITEIFKIIRKYKWNGKEDNSKENFILQNFINRNKRVF